MANPATPVVSDAAWAKIAWSCRIIGSAGVIILFGLLIYTIYLFHVSNNADACRDLSVRNVAADPAETNLQIIGIDPRHRELALNHSFCIEVENVVSPNKQAAVYTSIVALAHNASSQAAAAANAANARNATSSEALPGDADKAKQTLISAKETYASAQSKFAEAQKPRVIVLYLNGRVSPLTATARPIPDPQPLTFDVLGPNDANSPDAAYWRALLSEPTTFGRIPVRVGVAEQGAPAPRVYVENLNGSKKDGISFVTYTPLQMVAGYAGMIGIALLFFGFAYGTTMLRSDKTKDSAYSLSLVQMAIWLVLTTSGFLYIWVITGEYENTFPSSLFVLIGISGATATAARVIDRGQTAPKSRGFFRDIVGDWQDGEVQLQRIQIIAWTIILALIFFANLIGKLTLTSFDSNLLVLTGIANGVYVSLKPQEAKGPQVSPAQTATPQTTT